MSSIGSSNHYGQSIQADLSQITSSNPPGGLQIGSEVYKDDTEAVAGLRTFYMLNHFQSGKSQSFRFENSAVEYAAKIFTEISMYYHQRTALELSMKEGKEPDFTRLKNFAKQLYSNDTPIARLFVGCCLTANGGKMLDCSEQFIPSQLGGISSNLFGSSSTVSFSSSSIHSPYYPTIKNKNSTLERLTLPSIPTQTPRTINGEPIICSPQTDDAQNAQAIVSNVNTTGNIVNIAVSSNNASAVTSNVISGGSVRTIAIGNGVSQELANSILKMFK